uniref:DUF4817 domain-containing protein n=1 Tax=Haemonchus placei TaxID=6290 RepID=A0A0N4X9K7_HAEPC
LVGARDGVYMRVAVLHGDVDQSRMFRCVCLDYNAVYNFERSELFPLPDGFSVNEVPTNTFLGRIRGTHYIYDDKKRREAAHLINSNQPISGKFDTRRKNLKNSIVCGKCGSEISTRKGQRDKKRGRKLSASEEVKSWNGGHLKETITDAGCRRVPSVTEQLMSVARKMHARDEQEVEERVLSDDGAQGKIWSPSPERRDSRSLEDVRISQRLEVEADMRTLTPDHETTRGTDGPSDRDIEGKENIDRNEFKKTPRTIDYFSIRNAEECEAVQCCKPETERKTVFSGQAATTKSDGSGKVAKSNDNDVQQKKVIEVNSDIGSITSATKNKHNSEDRERFSPDRAELPPPLLVQSTITKVGSKTQVPQSHLNETGMNESSKRTAVNAAAEDMKNDSRTQFERFSVPMLSPTPSSTRSDASDEKSLENLKSVLRLYEAARRCSREPSSRIESADMFATMAIANAGRLLIVGNY